MATSLSLSVRIWCISVVFPCYLLIMSSQRRVGISFRSVVRELYSCIYFMSSTVECSTLEYNCTTLYSTVYYYVRSCTAVRYRVLKAWSYFGWSVGAGCNFHTVTT